MCFLFLSTPGWAILLQHLFTVWDISCFNTTRYINGFAASRVRFFRGEGGGLDDGAYGGDEKIALGLQKIDGHSEPIGYWRWS